MRVVEERDYRYFLLGASITAGRSFWVGDDGEDNKFIINEAEQVVGEIVEDRGVESIKIKRDDSI